MSRIGKAPIAIPAGVTVQVNNDVVTVKGPKGELSQKVNPELDIKIEDGQVVITRPSDAREHRAQHGLYRASAEGQVLELSLGFSHAIYIKLPKEVKVEAKTERNKNPLIILESGDKQLLGQVCAKIRSLRKPEPYKGKGIKFVGEIIRRKSGKSAGAK